MELSLETKAADALTMLNKFGFDANKPTRLISGIAISSRKSNVNDDAFIASGVQFTLPTPLLWSHDYGRPLGRVNSIQVRGDQLRFTAEVSNSMAWVDQIWSEIKAGNAEMASVHVTSIDGPAIDGTYTRWRLHEISILQLGADAGAIITRCAERSTVVHSDGRPSETVYWSKS